MSTSSSSVQESAGAARNFQAAAAQTGNRPERLAWFQDQALGLFIHWSVDVQLGSVISHSLVGASPDYCHRYFNELPRTFNPTRFDPDEWARLAKVAGMRYVVFTTKHHNGFCMFETQTTDFNVLNTPFGRDVTREVVEAFRRWGIAIGFYFSPDDFWMLHRQGHEISRDSVEADPRHNPELMAHNQAQVRELLTQYGPVDVIFFDGQAEGLKQLAWELQPDIVVTRGDLATPEQHIPDQAIPGPWEACFTLGTQWAYKPTNEVYKSGTQLIQMLIETRAKGGNLLLNVGPKPDGTLPVEQEARIQEMGLWLFVNGEAIYQVRPYNPIRETLTLDHTAWYTQARDGSAIYAIITGSPWTYGERKVLTLKNVRASDQSTVSLLGQSGRVLEYRPDVNPEARWEQDERGLHISAMRAQRLYNDRRWPNPVTLKITHPATP
ncbi:alpha-L-fucosidase [Litorilinea aerophila]|uniref:alpha-L-fucosidase n=1 Tax=Litorilinea aerophila TaxID=1204385 RepID=A0A540VDL7_9CHLR|nr:alpha-L-fucosidase [Litorilinea aerophila]MCC9077486.1 alpha-L-fucosidase [Litorilinea aerophila]